MMFVEKKGRYSAIFLGLWVLLFVVSCSKGATVSGNGAVDVLGGPLTPYTATIAISVPLTENATLYYAEGENIEKNYITDFYLEKLNIQYVGKWTVDASQANEKLNAAVSSNDLPDMFEASYELLGRLIKAGQVQPIGDVYEKYASPRLREICEYQNGMGFLAGSSGGKLYALPIAADFADNIAVVFIRKDWLDKLNLTIPRTMDELLTVARAFRDRDPDGNGVNDTIPFALDKDFGLYRIGINTLSNPLNAYSAIWMSDGEGGLKYGSIQPEMKDALLLMQNMYKEGLLDKEFGIKDTLKIAEEIAAGKIGIYPGVYWSSLFPLATSVGYNPNADWVPCTIPVNKDGNLITQNKIFSYKTVVVRAGFEHPEALIKSLNLWVEMFHGEYANYFNDLLSTERYKPGADSWHGNAKPVFVAHPEKNLALSANFIEAWDAQNIDLCTTGEARNRYELVSAGGAQGWAHKKFLYEAEPIVKLYDDFVYDEFVGAPTPTMITRLANLNKLEYEAFLGIIMGGSINNFDSFIQEWRAQGGDTITKEVSDWYKSVK
jgi:putative aldouronate transport system substrate-binding protein